MVVRVRQKCRMKRCEVATLDKQPFHQQRLEPYCRHLTLHGISKMTPVFGDLDKALADIDDGE